jgi:hypothetical protein
MSANQFHITLENKTSHNMKHVHILKLQNMKLCHKVTVYFVFPARALNTGTAICLICLIYRLIKLTPFDDQES